MAQGKPRKPTPNQRAFAEETERIQALISKARKQGIVFIEEPKIPTPQRVTKKQLDLVKSVDLPFIKSQGYTLNKSTGELTPFIIHPRKVKQDEDYVKHPRIATNKEYTPHPLTPEERKRIAQQNADKRKQRMATDPEFAQHMRDVWQKAGERLAKTPKAPPYSKLTPEEAKRRRSQSAIKASQTRKQNLAKDPILAQQEKQRKQEQWQKIRIAREIWELEHPEEAKAKRQASARKSAETRRQRELNDPQYAEEMKRKRSEAGKKGAQTRALKRTPVGIVNETDNIIYPTPPEQLPPIPQLPPEDTTPNVPSADAFSPQDLPQFTPTIIDEFQYQLGHTGSTPELSTYLVELFRDAIDDVGEDVMAQRIANAQDRLWALADAIQYDSRDEERERHVRAFLDIIYAGNPPPFVLTDMADKVFELASSDRLTQLEFLSNARKERAVARAKAKAEKRK